MARRSSRDATRGRVSWCVLFSACGGQARSARLRGSLTASIVFVVGLTLEHGRQLLKVLFGVVKHALHGAQQLILVLAPMPLVGEAQDAEALDYQISNVGEQRAHRVEAHGGHGGRRDLWAKKPKSTAVRLSVLRLDTWETWRW